MSTVEARTPSAQRVIFDHCQPQYMIFGKWHVQSVVSIYHLNCVFYGILSFFYFVFLCLASIGHLKISSPILVSPIPHIILLAVIAVSLQFRFPIASIYSSSLFAIRWAITAVFLLKCVLKNDACEMACIANFFFPLSFAGSVEEVAQIARPVLLFVSVASLLLAILLFIVTYAVGRYYFLYLDDVAELDEKCTMFVGEEDERRTPCCLCGLTCCTLCFCL